MMKVNIINNKNGGQKNENENNRENLWDNVSVLAKDFIKRIFK